MNNIIKFTFSALLATTVLTSCELDQLSPGNLTPEEATKTMNDAEAWRMGLYSTMRGTYGATNTFLSDLQTDAFVPTNQYGNYYGTTARWTFGNSDIDDQTPVWANNYSLANRANEVLAQIPAFVKKLGLDAEELTAKQQADLAELMQIKGEAHLVRAIAYATLTTYFTDRYDAATAKTQKGLPIVAVVNVTAKPVRQSLDSTYNFILGDLTAARSLMTDDNRSADYLHNAAITQSYLLPTVAIDLLEARVQLNKGNKVRAAELADAVIANPAYSLIDDAEQLASMWLNDEGSEILFQIFQNKDERGAEWSVLRGYNANLTAQLGGITAYIPFYQPSMEALSLFDGSDIRAMTTFSQEWTYSAYSATGSINKAFVLLLNKYPGNPALKKGTGDCYNTTKLFRLPEAYLIAAEAKMESDPAGALTAFNDLHTTARGADPVTDIAQLKDEIANEYVREFIGEGLIFGAYKRLGRGVKRADTGQQQPGTAKGVVAIDIEPTNKRWTWEIPQNDLFANPKLEGNWTNEN